MLRICYGLRWTVVRCEKLSKVIFHAWNFKPCLVFYGDIVSADANAYVVADVNSVVVGDLSAAADTNAVADVNDVVDVKAVSDAYVVADANAVADVNSIDVADVKAVADAFYVLMPILLMLLMPMLVLWRLGAERPSKPIQDYILSQHLIQSLCNFGIVKRKSKGTLFEQNFQSFLIPALSKVDLYIKEV